MSDAYTITYSSESIEDLRDLHYYISHRLESPQAARRTVSRIRTAVRGLKTFPFRHGLVSYVSLQREGIRSLTSGNYMVLYKADESS
ncbi:MAG: type II toxin-antitoxin system RelE/ParE family toxin [Atopobiaceae bacterium]|nr:type II toxin-antitoxin system RelE/ParE family toxin [Atopobiaceae bacterium]